MAGTLCKGTDSWRIACGQSRSLWLCRSSSFLLKRDGEAAVKRYPGSVSLLSQVSQDHLCCPFPPHASAERTEPHLRKVTYLPKSLAIVTEWASEGPGGFPGVGFSSPQITRGVENRAGLIIHTLCPKLPRMGLTRKEGALPFNEVLLVARKNGILQAHL